MDRKRTHNESLAYCRLCLSTERSLQDARSVRGPFQLITGVKLTSERQVREARVCWECRAALQRVQRLRRQALRAQRLLAAAQLDRSLSAPKCLSLLTVTHLWSLSIDSNVSDTKDRVTYSDTSLVSASPKPNTFVIKFHDYCDSENLSSSMHVKVESLTEPNLLKDKEMLEAVSNKKGTICTDALTKEEGIDDGITDPAESLSADETVESSASTNEGKVEALRGRTVSVNRKPIVEKFEVSMSQWTAALEAERLNFVYRGAKAKCVSCAATFRSVSTLKRHISMYHSVKLGDHVCQLCLRRFPDESHRARHTALHSRLHRCSRGDFVSLWSSAVELHIATAHGECREPPEHRPDATRGSKRDGVELSDADGNPEGVGIGAADKQASEMQRPEPKAKKRCNNTKRTRFARAFVVQSAATETEVNEFLERARGQVSFATNVPYKCDVCIMGFAGTDDLKEHIYNYEHSEEKHTLETLARFHYVYRPSASEIARRAELLTVRRGQFFCESCLVSVEEGSQERHRTEHHSESAGAHVCDICASRFDCPQSLRSHRKDDHENWYRCAFCHYQVESRAAITEHVGRKHQHIKAVPFKFLCRKCNEFFLRTSFDIHTSTCGASLKVKTKFREIRRLAREATFKKRELCIKCGGLFSVISRHSRRCGLDKPPPAEPCQCDICGKRYPSKIAIYNHMNVHMKRHVCDTCGKRFPFPADLRAHVRLAHENFRYTCDMCEKTFREACDAKNHRNEHMGLTPFKCKHCDRAYATTRMLSDHVVRIHYGKSKKKNKARVQAAVATERAHKCDICPKSFARRNSLMTHRRVHSDEREFACDVCARRFHFKAGMRAHRLLTHPDVNIDCESCGVVLPSVIELKEHMKSHILAK